MYKKNTVFILGAGASYEYGYPTGEELVQEVLVRAARLKQWCLASANGFSAERLEWESERDTEDHRTGPIQSDWKRRADLCLSLETRLRAANPLVIDYFLGLNRDLQDLGRLLIAWTILACETAPLRPIKDWVRFVRHQLTDGCLRSADLSDNRVSFVTFNYDISLEQHLRSGLVANTHFQAADVDRFLGNGRVIHVYGRVRDPIASSLNLSHLKVPREMDAEGMATFNTLYQLAEGIRVIDPYDKVTDETALEGARRQIADAATVFVLGFGFDKNNVDRIGLNGVHQSPVPGDRKTILMTNFEDHGRVNRRADRVFFPGSSYLTDGAMRMQSATLIVERSIRGAYDALARDFDEIAES